jgi:RNA polymerase sigma factor (TIGR02999 family)
LNRLAVSVIILVTGTAHWHRTAKGLAMSDVTRILAAIEYGDPSAADQLLPLVYDELRKLAAAKLASEKPGQTLQATTLVHEAYLRLVGVEQVQEWDARGHFFAAAAEAMRRILIDRAKRKRRPKHGGDRVRIDVDTGFPATRRTSGPVMQAEGFRPR